MTVPAERNAAAYGFAPEASGLENWKALQRAVDRGGTVTVDRPGVYALAATVQLGSDTALNFGRGVVVRKTDEAGAFSHVFMNRGAVGRKTDRRITIDGLHLEVNGVFTRDFDQADRSDRVYGLQAHLAFSYVSDLQIRGFRCYDLEKQQFAVQVSTFEDLLIEDVIIHGEKDGLHLGPGKRFTIRDGVFRCFDDAIALNAHDYATSNPELGWIEQGVIENCRDLDAPETTGFFCRILAGGWLQWQPGLEVRHSDAVIHEGRLYRVHAKPDNQTWVSKTPPTHTSGLEELDGIPWGWVQDKPVQTAGVRDVVFRDIFLEKARPAFSIHFDNDRYSRSYYPGAPVPVQQRLTFDTVHCLQPGATPLLVCGTPVDVVTFRNCHLADNPFHFHAPADLDDYGTTHLLLQGCSFQPAETPFTLLTNQMPGKTVVLRTSDSLVPDSAARFTVDAGPGSVTLASDLPGLEEG
ncbi:MAG: hypothetical protein ACFE0O_04570 [Opitutales bacterium]